MNEIEFLKDRPIYKYLKLVETGGLIDYIDIKHFEEEDSWDPDLKFLDVFGNYQSDGILLYRIYKSLWHKTLNEEFDHKTWEEPRKEVHSIQEIIKKEGKLEYISLNFGKKHKPVKIESEALLKQIKECINSSMQHIAEVQPKTSQKVGERSSFVAEYIKNLYPFFLYLKEIVFVGENCKLDTEIREFIIDYIGLNQNPNEELYTKVYNRVNENQINTSHKSQNHPPKYLLISSK